MAAGVVTADKLQHQPTRADRTDPAQQRAETARQGVGAFVVIQLRSGHHARRMRTEQSRIGHAPLQGIWPLRRVWGMEQDRREFEEFYTAARDHCLKVVLISVGDRHLADDLVAEAFTRAWASWRKVRIHPAPRAWVVRTALNMHVSWWRRRRREVALDSDHGAAAASPYPGLDSSLVAALRRLPPRQREVIVLRLLLDLDTATTAQTLGMPSGTVASHLHRGLNTLRREIPTLDYQERIR
jgi:RNA polymerase sigma-70 factor (sigma-E family)